MAKNTIQIADKPTLDSIKAEIEELKTTLASMSEMLSGGGEEIIRKSMEIKTGSTTSMQIDGIGKVIINCIDGDISFTYFKIIADDIQLNSETLSIFKMRTVSTESKKCHIYEIPIMKSLSITCTVPSNTGLALNKLNAIAIIKK